MSTELFELFVYQLDSVGLPGTPENDRVQVWLRANGIPVNEIPVSARFCIAGTTIQIELFDSLPDEHGAPRRFVSMFGRGFAKRERQFPLVARPEEFDVPCRTLGPAFTPGTRGPAWTPEAV